MPLKTLISRSLITLAAGLLVIGPLSAVAQSRHGGGQRHGSYGNGGYGHGGYGHGGGYRYGGNYWGPGLFFGGVALGVGLGAYNYGYGYPGYPSYSGYPAYVVVEPAPVYVPVPVQPIAQAQPAQRQAPDPVVYPRNGQSAAQTEADRQACNRWATTLPSAMNDASVFNRATAACMDGHGYTVR